MKNKKIFMSYWFYVTVFAVIIVLSLAMFVLGIHILLTRQDQIPAGISIVIFGASFSIFLFFCAGDKLLQWTVIDEKGIRVRCLYKKIIERNWDEIQDVYIKLYPVSASYGVHIKYIVFDDGRNIPYRKSGINTKKDFIAVRYGKRAVKSVSRFWNKPIDEH